MFGNLSEVDVIMGKGCGFFFFFFLLVQCCAEMVLVFGSERAVVRIWWLFLAVRGVLCGFCCVFVGAEFVIADIVLFL